MTTYLSKSSSSSINYSSTIYSLVILGIPDLALHLLDLKPLAPNYIEAGLYCFRSPISELSMREISSKISAIDFRLIWDKSSILGSLDLNIESSLAIGYYY